MWMCVHDLPGYGSRSFEIAERDVCAGRRRRDVHGFRHEGMCELCSAGPCTYLNGNVNKQSLRQHEQGRKHTDKFALYNQGYDAYICEKEEADEREHARVCQVIEGRLHVERCHILLLAFVKVALCQKFGSLEAGRNACTGQNKVLDPFMQGPAPASGWYLWQNCLRYAASHGHTFLDLIVPHAR